MDLFNRKRVKELQQQVALLNQEANDKEEFITQTINTVSKLEKLLTSKQQENDKLTQSNINLQVIINSLDIESLTQQVETLNQEINSKKSTLNYLEDEIYIQSVGLYNPEFRFNTSQEYKDNINYNLSKQKEMVKTKRVVVRDGSVSINGDVVKGQNLSKFLSDSSVLAYNLSCEGIIDKITTLNVEHSRAKLDKVYIDINKGLSILGLHIDKEYRNLKREQFEFEYEYQLKLAEEKEERKRQVEIIKEQKRVEEECAKAKVNLEKELKHYQQQWGKCKCDAEYAMVDAYINDIKKKLDECDYRISNQKAGYLYVISNCDMKDGMVKLGVTRRLNPMDRVDELGNASHAFKYSVHGMVFSEDCFKLESQIHKYFNDKRVNKINTRKEYFYATLEEVQEALKVLGYNIELQESINEDYLLSEVQ